MAQTYTEDLWPVSEGIYGVGVSYTRPSEDWIDGVSETVGAIASFTFYGSKVRIVGRTDALSGIAEVKLDEGEWTDVDFFADVEQEAQVYVAENLSDDIHRLQVRVSGRFNPLSLGFMVALVRFDYAKYMIVTLSDEETYNLPWNSVVVGE